MGMQATTRLWTRERRILGGPNFGFDEIYSCALIIDDSSMRDIFTCIQESHNSIYVLYCIHVHTKNRNANPHPSARYQFMSKSRMQRHVTQTRDSEITKSQYP